MLLITSRDCGDPHRANQTRGVGWPADKRDKPSRFPRSDMGAREGLAMDDGEYSRYAPDWVSLAAAVERIVAVRASEDEAREDLCRAIADKKVRVRGTTNSGKVYSPEYVSVPAHLNAKDIDWSNSRPQTAWWIVPP